MIHSASLLTDGDIAVAMPLGASLLRQPAAGGQMMPLAALETARGERNQYFPLALPDGEHLLYASWGAGAVDDVRIGLLDLTTGVARRLDVKGTYPLGMLEENLVYSDLTGTILAMKPVSKRSPLALASTGIHATHPTEGAWRCPSRPARHQMSGLPM